VYKTPDVVAFVEEMRGELLRESTSESRALSTTRSITVQCLLMQGARSFSHFLNVVERYLAVLHAVSGTPDGKFEILEIVGGFWRRNVQFIGIIFDKLMQYQIVDPVDVVSWAFEGNGIEPPGGAGAGERSEGLSTFRWEVLKGAVDKANGRVHKAQARVVQQTKADDDARAARHAAAAADATTSTNGDGDGDGDGDGMEVDVANVNGACWACWRCWRCLFMADLTARAIPERPEEEEESVELQKAKRAHGTLVGDQKAVLARVMSGFVTVLGATEGIVREEGWENRGTWGRREWEMWETWGWYRHFCREVRVVVVDLVVVD
jgi:nuclear cap-binding protein subunit 1